MMVQFRMHTFVNKIKKMTGTLQFTQFQAWMQQLCSTLDLYDDRYALDGFGIWKENGLELYHHALDVLDETFEETELDWKRREMIKFLPFSEKNKTAIAALEEKKLEKVHLPNLVCLKDQPLTNNNPHPRSIVSDEESASLNSKVTTALDDVDPFQLFDDYVDPLEEEDKMNDVNPKLTPKECPQYVNKYSNNSFLHNYESKMFHISRGYIYEDYEMKYNYPCVYLKPNSEWSIFPYLKNVIRTYTQLPYKVTSRTTHFTQVLSDEGLQIPLLYGSKEQMQHEVHSCHESESCALDFLESYLWKSIYLKILLNHFYLFNGIHYTSFPWRNFSYCLESKAFDITLPYVNTAVNLAHSNVSL